MYEILIPEAFNKIKGGDTLFVVSHDKDGTPNAMVCGWATKCSHEPPLFAVALSKQGVSHKLIKETKEFVVAVSNNATENYVKLFSASHGNKADILTGIPTTSGSKTKCLLLDLAELNLECKLVQTIEAGDHVLLLGQVAAAYSN